MAAEQRPRRHRIRNYLIGFVATLLVVVVGVGVWLWIDVEDAKRETAARQEKLAPFYRLPAGWRDVPVGALLRQQRLADAPTGEQRVEGAVPHRTLRRNARPSARAWCSRRRARRRPTAVRSWRGRTGRWGWARRAPRRAPSTRRRRCPVSSSSSTPGWVVAATDYAGLGTPGTLEYLVGEAAARDVVNSVRAARGSRRRRCRTTRRAVGAFAGRALGLVDRGARRPSSRPN